MRDTRRTRVVLVILVLVSLTLIAINGNSGPGKALRSGAGAVFGPVQRVAASAFRPVHDLFAGIGKDQQAKLDRLQKENDALRLQERAGQYASCRAGELNALTKIAGLGQYTIVAAQVISLAPLQSAARTAQIDAGARDGLKVGMTVINGDGLVGKIESVTDSTATVMLAVDPTFNAGIRIETSLQIGYVTGGGDDPMQVTMFNGQAILKPGDRVVTDFRGDSAFAAGIPVGTLTSVRGTLGSLQRFASLKPYVDFSALDILGVIVLNPRTDPRDAVLPPKPSPGATPASSCGSPAIAATTASPTPSTTGGTATAGTTASPGTSHVTTSPSP